MTEYEILTLDKQGAWYNFSNVMPNCCAAKFDTLEAVSSAMERAPHQFKFTGELKVYAIDDERLRQLTSAELRDLNHHRMDIIVLRRQGLMDNRTEHSIDMKSDL